MSTFEDRVHKHFEKLAAAGSSPYPKPKRPMSKRPGPPAGHSPLPPGDRNFQADDYRNRKANWGDYRMYKDRAGAQMAPLGVPQKDRKSKVDFSKGGGRQLATGPSGQSKRPAPKADPVNSPGKAAAFLHSRNPPNEGKARLSAGALSSFGKQNRAQRATALAPNAPARKPSGRSGPTQLAGHRSSMSFPKGTMGNTAAGEALNSGVEAARSRGAYDSAYNKSMKGKTTAFRSAMQSPKQAADAKYGKQLSGKKSSMYFPKGSFGNTSAGKGLNKAVAPNVRGYADSYFKSGAHKNTAFNAAAKKSPQRIANK